MCCFTKNVESVTDTNIFARLGSKGNQVLIYQMNFKSKEELAMVLPIPVKAGAGEKAVTFFDFSGYLQVFANLGELFPVQAKTYGRGADPFGAPAARGALLEVHSVGAFDASYVPSIADFSRLDARFRLPEQVWPKLPGYSDFGFAVFKLKPNHGPVHPMAFAFPTALTGQVFFPTLHIHDGKIHDREVFDHTLYMQGEGFDLDTGGWQESPKIAVAKVKCGYAHNMVRPEMHVHRNVIRGNMRNGDIIVQPKKI